MICLSLVLWDEGNLVFWSDGELQSLYSDYADYLYSIGELDNLEHNNRDYKLTEEDINEILRELPF